MFHSVYFTLQLIVQLKVCITLYYNHKVYTQLLKSDRAQL